jgi:hypothetical protein
MTTREIGTVPKVQLPGEMSVAKSQYLYQAWHRLRPVTRYGRTIAGIKSGQGGPPPNPIHGAHARLAEFECEDRVFSGWLFKTYEDDIEYPLELRHRKIDKTLSEMCTGLDALHRRVAAAAKAFGAKTDHQPPQRPFPTSRPQDSAAVNNVPKNRPPSPPIDDDHFARLPLPSFTQDPHAREVDPRAREVARIKMTNVLNAINRRLWKYHWRFDQHWKNLKAIEQRADDRLAFLNQRLGWAGTLIAELCELEKSLKRLEDAAKMVSPGGR